MELRLLATFEKVAEVLSFTRAAAELGYAQSSVTSQVKALETALGTELFERLGGRIRLTGAGERLLPYARRMAELAEEARAAVAAGEAAGTITIGTMESLTTYRLPPLLEYVHHRHPAVRLSLRPTLGDATRRALRQGTYDLGFLMEAETAHEGLETEVLAPEPLTLVAAPGHALASRTELATADLAATALVGTEPGCAYRDLFEAELAGAATGPSGPEFLEFGTIEASKRAVASGLGIALLPRITVQEELASGALVALGWDPPFTLFTQLAWRRGKRLPAHVRLFVEQARRLARE
ncbi:LysR family transcriptional regulator [Streptomyces sp. R302]|uniref:LysR family transcriptional regulator n=1 Tax=unclassified Streptomyces TaxID=2593676 RepID=UPI00145D6E4E|nr:MULTISPECIES: LysR family transcriptional regulator [unclassified Streptomyces]NML54911.1 LysR family transcriptional regulator [Streptomyces sp. R301]NML83598.1 LysR family transcriptional regulator [Streptomyces sp. R302]